ncbi:Nicotinamide phosphoribosyltransferase, partial [Ophiophagus hannah]
MIEVLYRPGVISQETAGVGTFTQVVNIKGIDMIAGIVLIKEYYGTKHSVPGYSVPCRTQYHNGLGKDHEKGIYKYIVTYFLQCLYLRSVTVMIFKTLVQENLLTLLKGLNILGKKFHVIENEKVYKVIIQGDGIIARNNEGNEITEMEH